MVKMAVRQLGEKPKKSKKEIENPCPKCGEETLEIEVEGMFVKWLTCPKCKFKKLVKRKDDRSVKVVPLK
ncbi:MAG: hypothetical protein ACE5J4_03420 [Candidatus Aenigmatarchaeota archaeon]